MKRGCVLNRCIWSVCVCLRVQPRRRRGSCGGERRNLPEAFCWEARVCRGPQRLHLLPHIGWWWKPAALQKGLWFGPCGFFSLEISVPCNVVKVWKERTKTFCCCQKNFKKTQCQKWTNQRTRNRECILLADVLCSLQCSSKVFNLFFTSKC